MPYSPPTSPYGLPPYGTSPYGTQYKSGGQPTERSVE
jgi:hypothetical protein